MAENKSPEEIPSSSKDNELESLLDDALSDFDKPPGSSTKLSSSEKVTGAQSEDNGASSWDDEFLAGEPQKMLEQTMKALLGGSGDSQLTPEQFAENLKSVAEETTKVLSESATNPEFSAAIAETLRNLSENSENVQAELNNDITSMLSNMNLESEDAPDIFPLMHTLMESFLSKDVLYPCLKALEEKYPPWLDEHKTTISEKEYNNHSKQLKVIKDLCEEFEKESPEDGNDVKKRRFVKILSLMEEMQALGQPPQEIFGVDSPLASPDIAARIPPMDPSQCSVM